MFWSQDFKLSSERHQNEDGLDGNSGDEGNHAGEDNHVGEDDHHDNPASLIVEPKVRPEGSFHIG